MRNGNTRLARYFDWVPLQADCRKEVKAGESATAQTFCPEKEVPVGNDDQHCVHPAGEAVMDSNTAKDFVNKVVAAYNEKHPEAPIDFNGQLPTAGEFVDALNIAASLGIAQVEKSAVCELGRKMVDLSKDKHYKQWPNEFGAFYVYTGEEAVLYPAKYYGAMSQCDYRFLPKSMSGSCTGIVNMGHEFHYNNYTWQGWSKKNNTKRFGSGINTFRTSRKALAKALARDVESFPLRAVVEPNIGSFTGLQDCLNRGENYRRKGDGATSCGTEVSDYKGSFGYLVDGTKDGGQSGSGLACSSLQGTMQVADALKYVNTACQVGLDFKPYGTGKLSTGSGSPVQNANSSENARRNIPPGNK